jgi:hypothetical protein
MPVIMPPAFDAVPAIIRAAAHKPANQAPVPHPIKPSSTPPQPTDTTQGPQIVGPAPVTLPPHLVKPSGTPPQPADGTQLPGVVGKPPVSVPPPAPSS